MLDVLSAVTQFKEYENVSILLCDSKIANVHAILPALEEVSQRHGRLLIIADNVEGEALATLILNKMRGLNVVAVKAPGFGDNRKNNLQDIATLTGGQVVSEEMGLKLENFDPSWLGRWANLRPGKKKQTDHHSFCSANKVSISPDDTIILDGGGDSAKIKERCELINDAISRTTSSWGT